MIEAYKELIELKYNLIEIDSAIEYFHASEDKQNVRDKVFEIINKYFNDSIIDSLIIEKRKTEPFLQDSDRFYVKMFGYLIRHVLKQTNLDDISKIIIFTDKLPLESKRKAVEKGLKLTLSQMLSNTIKYIILHHSSKSNSDLQLADYCNWAIFRKWSRNDERSYLLISKYIRSEFDIFSTGTRYYY